MRSRTLDVDETLDFALKLGGIWLLASIVLVSLWALVLGDWEWKYRLQERRRQKAIRERSWDD